MLDDFEDNGRGRYYNHYTVERGKRYFYDLLKPLANLGTVTEEEYMDWGQDHTYLREIGVGECAGAALDMVSTILNDAKEKLGKANEWLANGDYAGSIYWAYTAQLVAAKAMLLAKDIKCNTHHKILDDFQVNYVDTREVQLNGSFPEKVLAQKNQEPTRTFANFYLQQAQNFLDQTLRLRNAQLRQRGGVDQQVIGAYYKA